MIKIIESDGKHEVWIGMDAASLAVPSAGRETYIIGSGASRGRAINDAIIELNKDISELLRLREDSTCVEDGCNEPRYVGSFCHTHGVETTNPTAEKV